jgi:hypothetical protein
MDKETLRRKIRERIARDVERQEKEMQQQQDAKQASGKQPIAEKGEPSLQTPPSQETPIQRQERIIERWMRRWGRGGNNKSSK